MKIVGLGGLHNHPACAVLIDGGYLDRVQADDFANVRIDIGKLGDELAANMERLRTYYYHCMPFQSASPTADEKTRYAAMDSFIFNLKKLPRFQFRQGKSRTRPHEPDINESRTGPGRNDII